jgi:hypothetical protein
MRTVVASKGASKPRLAKPPISTPTERRLKLHACQAYHLRRLAAVLANNAVRRDIRPGHFESSDGALVPALEIVQDYEVDTHAVLAREIGDGLQSRMGRKSVIGKPSFAPYAVAGKKRSVWGSGPAHAT